MNKRVTGIGGIFFKTDDPKKLGEWYAAHLGVDLEPEGDAAVFRWLHKEEPERGGATVWGLFEPDSEYFGNNTAQFMVNYRVEDLDAVKAKLESEGVEIEGEIVENKHGRFLWIRDLEGRRLELWQAPDNY